MSKSKSRQPSKSTSGANKNGTKQASAAAEERQTAKALPPVAVHRPVTRDAAKYERRQAERQTRYQAERRARRNKRIAWLSGVLAVVIIASVVGYFFYQSHAPNANASINSAPYQEAVYNSNYPPVDNVYCDQLEQSIEHIHVHVSVYIDGQISHLPSNTGIVTDQQGNATCYYWLHVHAQNQDVIHIESPSTEQFVLGQFINEWNQQFNSLGFPSQLLLSKGWTIWVNGHQYNGSLDSVPLAAHNLITIAFNSPNVKPDTTYNWNGL